MTAEQNKAIVRAMLEEVWHGNLAILNDHPGMHQTIPFLTELHASVKFAAQEVVQQLADGDWVATRFVSEGTTVKDFMGSPAGTHSKMETILLHRIQNGKIVEEHAQAGRIG